MHWYLMQEITRQREKDLRRAARQHRLVTAARTVRRGGEPTRSEPMIFVALLLAAFH